MTTKSTPNIRMSDRIGGALLLAVIAGGLAACSKTQGTSSSSRAAQTQLTPADFTGGTAQASSSATAPTPAPKPVVSASSASGGINDAVAYSGPPKSASAPTTETTSSTVASREPAPKPASTANTPTRVMIDELVGQINGEPLYASDFYAPMDQRLRQQAARMSPIDWTRMVANDTREALRDRLRDKLLLAEFQASLTPEARRGLIAFIEGMREDVLSENRGSEGIANERLESEQGKSLSQFVQDKADRQLIIEQLRRSIVSKVQVSRRDVVRYYELNPEKFSAKSSVTFRVIQVPLADSARVEAVEQGLAAGTPIDELATKESEYNRTAGGLFEQSLPAGGLAKAHVFGPEPLNNAATQLEVGKTSSRIDFDGSAWWIHLEKLENQPGRSLYDAQLEIENLIRGERFNEEERRYFLQLVKRASVSDQQVMIERLVTFAKNRYLGEQVKLGVTPKPAATETSTPETQTPAPDGASPNG